MSHYCIKERKDWNADIADLPAAGRLKKDFNLAQGEAILNKLVIVSYVYMTLLSIHPA
jgi:hypothetical protein